ncbi:MAG: ribonuclease domain-containing protein [Pseudomonadota bacterium]
MKRFLIVVCALLALIGAALAQGPAPIGDIALAALPREAHVTLALVRAGGPFPYAQDGRVFGNREKILPARQGGYYREYTVKTPGASDRGARRIVAGTSGEYYYTDDHYNSFRRIRE